MNLGVYIHIPFCVQKCLYCDFPSVAGGAELYDAYTTALCREIAGKGGILSAHRVDTIYIGGGTPTVLPAACLERIGRAIRDHAAVAEGAEFSVEANPGTLTADRLAALGKLGVNRLSIGIQAFEDAVLAAAGRIHTAAQAAQAVLDAHAAGFANLSVDLMYGLPGQTPDSFRAGLERAAVLPVSHISAYGLKVEEGTPFANRRAAGHLDLPDEDSEETMYELAVSWLPAHGFERYEISNYAKPGAECRHNLKYWRYQPYIGLGAAAHSFWKGERIANTADIAAYIECMMTGRSPVASRERNAPAVAMAEYIFLALRTAEGLSFPSFAAEFGVLFPGLYADTSEKLAAQGLVAMVGETLRLTPLGMKYGNVVFAAFLPKEA